ncbi:MAG: sugar ABC transporter ATP-binding protein, partial [Spirochaetaceae bacterium]|nr:sugar ABC transporter ATP-binding protein [Spirochaetaceae bacterium]
MKELIIKTTNITKRFPGTVALDQFSFELSSGEVHCLIGENGAGKSTFIKILSGVYSPDSGDLIIDNKRYDSLSTQMARGLGIHTVYQDDVLVPHISVAENIYLGSQVMRRKFFMNYRTVKKNAEELALGYGIDLDVQELYGNLNPADQQFTKILKTLAQSPKVLILDEPTQVFNVTETALVLSIVKKVSASGTAVVYIAHDLDEIIKVAHRVTVLRDGKQVAGHDEKIDELDPGLLAREMVGRPVDLFYKKQKHNIGDTVFEVKNLKLASSSTPINFSLKRGEILGIAGLKGSGRSAIARAVFGAIERYSGQVFYEGKDITPRNPIDAVRHGLAYLTEDKKADGLFLGMPVDQNITIVGLSSIHRFLIRMKKERDIANKFISRMKIKTANPGQEVQYLSGGNQQKAVIAKWLFKDANILIVDEPTHGIDVNAKI